MLMTLLRNDKATKMLVITVIWCPYEIRLSWHISVFYAMPLRFEIRFGGQPRGVQKVPCFPERADFQFRATPHRKQ